MYFSHEGVMVGSGSLTVFITAVNLIGQNYPIKLI